MNIREMIAPHYFGIWITQDRASFLQGTGIYLYPFPYALLLFGSKWYSVSFPKDPELNIHTIKNS